MASRGSRSPPSERRVTGGRGGLPGAGWAARQRRVSPPASRPRQWWPGATHAGRHPGSGGDPAPPFPGREPPDQPRPAHDGGHPDSQPRHGRPPLLRAETSRGQTRRGACLMSGTYPSGRARTSPPHFTAPWYPSCSEGRAGCNGVRADVRSRSRRRAGRIGARSGPVAEFWNPQVSAGEWQVSRPHSSNLTSALCPGCLLARAGHRWR